MSKNWIKIIVFLSICTLSLNASAQSKSSLEKKRKRLENDLSFARNILQKTDKQKKAELHELNALNHAISQSEVLINHLKVEVVYADSQITSQQRHLISLQKERDTEQKRIHKMAIKAYKSRKSMSSLTFVMSAGSFKQAMKRIMYLRKMSEYKQIAINNLKEKEDKLNYGIALLENSKYQKKEVMLSKEQEAEKVKKDLVVKDKIVKELTAKGKELKDKIRKNEIAISKLNATISRLIAQEMAAAQKREEEAAKKAEAKRKAEIAKNTKKETKSRDKETGTKETEVPKTSSKPDVMVERPESQKLSANFAANKGILSWPVGNGYVSQSFGVHPHPDLAGITLVNNGIDITAAKGSEVRAVFEGEVSAVLNIPGQQKAILVKHGDYFTVYSRLEEVYVKKGDKIKLHQKLGKVWTEDNGKTVLQFQVWKGQEKQNPALWIKK